MKARARYLGVVLCATVVAACGDQPLAVQSTSLHARLQPLAHLGGADGDVVLSGTGTATVDGRIAPGEWERAATVDFTLSTWGEEHPSRLYVMNDDTYLYIAVVITSEDFNHVVGEQGDVLNIYFDNDHDGGIAHSNSELGDDFLQAPIPYEGGFMDGFYCKFPCWMPEAFQRDIYDGGTVDADAAVTHTDPVQGRLGTYTYEFRKELDSGDAQHDFRLTPGDVLGVFVDYVDTPPGAIAGVVAAWPGPDACNTFGRFGGPPCVGADIRIAHPFIPVQIDVKPGSVQNSINPRSNGVTPVAILTTGSFDARSVDPSTVAFGPGATRARAKRSALEDVDGDGDVDMILHFETRALGIQCGQQTGVLTGRTVGGQAIEGADSINAVGCK
jgi:hypothetical protein